MLYGFINCPAFVDIKQNLHYIKYSKRVSSNKVNVNR